MKTVQEQIAVMLAWTAGKPIEVKKYDDTFWSKILEPAWNWADYDYRVKPKLKTIYVNQYEDGAWGVGHESRAQATRTAAGSDATMCRVGVKFIEAPDQN